jgi:hypothetical protein
MRVNATFCLRERSVARSRRAQWRGMTDNVRFVPADLYRLTYRIPRPYLNIIFYLA